MINNLEINNNYKLFVNNILKRMPLLLTEQLIQCLINFYKNKEKITKQEALEILIALQRQGELYLSQDGWTMTKGMYWRITDDKYRDSVKYDGIYRIDTIDKVCSRINKEQISSFWVVVNNMPNSNDFAVASSPWHFVFTTEETKTSPSCLYEVTYLPRSREDGMIPMFRSLPKYNDEYKKNVKRVAIVENKSIVWRLPYIGISDVYLAKNNNLELVETRKPEDAWKDYD